MSYFHPADPTYAQHCGSVRTPEMMENNPSSKERDRCVNSLFQQSADYSRSRKREEGHFILPAGAQLNPEEECLSGAWKK